MPQMLLSMRAKIAIFRAPQTMTQSIPSHRILEFLVSRLAGFLKIPPLALRMLRSANALSGLNKNTLPTELVPLNTLQLLRGLFNFTAMQTMEGWILPYWAQRQFNPRDVSFVPRSHLGLSVNVTHRNWTAVGSPRCTVEPVVDPRGMVTPFRNSWSIDVWLRSGDGILFPSQAASCRQYLLKGLPVVKTEFLFGQWRLEETAFVSTSTLVYEVMVSNLGKKTGPCEVAIAVRPFNPEGVAPTESVRFDFRRSAFFVDRKTVNLNPAPDRVHCSQYAHGDSAQRFQTPDAATDRADASCPTGFANGFASYNHPIGPSESRRITVSVALDSFSGKTQTEETVLQGWEKLLAGGAVMITPDSHINDMMRASLATLLMAGDGDSITPGPWTYHQFWFRDAAFMLRALDVFGFHSATRPVIESYPRRQETDGYFRSQKGEWDSNGQALWTVWQHAVLLGDRALAKELFPSLSNGVRWIQRKRLSGAEHDGTPWKGLLPKGLSAEHLGLADHYFWDNWWSTAGISAYLRLGEMIGVQDKTSGEQKLLSEYREALNQAIDGVRTRRRLREIPAGPERGIDSGMIGTCAAWYPLQELPTDDPRMLATLNTLERRFFRDGLFYQQFIHSGLNVYLSLQIAHAWLHAGDRRKFWRIMQSVIRRATPTFNYPEAIHPLTGGGVMGDGHHGWAAAELLLAMRDAFVRETWDPRGNAPSLLLLGGIPEEWWYTSKGFTFENAPVPGGKLTIACARSGHRMRIDYTLERSVAVSNPCRIFFSLPARVTSCSARGIQGSLMTQARNGATFEIPSDTSHAVLTCRLP
jgi:hypothetical protein